MFGSNVWLLFLDSNIDHDEYVGRLDFDFDEQLITATLGDIGEVMFKSPYRISEDYPLRAPEVGSWSPGELQLPTLFYTVSRTNFEGLIFKADVLNVSNLNG